MELSIHSQFAPRFGHTSAVWTLCALFLIVVVTGCRKGKAPTYPVHGKVVFADGQPLPGGRVLFRALDHEDHFMARSSIASDGSFNLSTFVEGDGAIAGKHQVAVYPPAAPAPKEGSRFAVVRAPQKAFIDPRFSNFDTSGIEIAVSSDEENTPTITVEPPGRK